MICGTLTIFGASPTAPPPVLRLSEFQKQSWQVEDGLPENNVRMIDQQADGRLLLATSSGLSTFDGRRFESFPVPRSSDGEAVNAFLRTKDGTLWIGTDGRGLLRYGADGTLIDISERAGHMNERIRNLYEDAKGALWIATQNGIERYQHNELKAFEKAGMISGDITTPFAEDDYGGMLFVTSNGLFQIEGDTWKPYPLRTVGMGRPVAVYRDLQHRLWVGTMNGMVQLNPRIHGGYSEIVAARIPSPVTVILSDANGNIWVGTRHGGVRRIRSNGASFSVDSWSSKDGLTDDSICSMFVDREQNLWIGSQTGGLSRWRKAAFAPYSEPESLSATIAANVFSDSHGDIWLGTWGAGLFRVHDGRTLNATPPGMSAMTPIRTIAENGHGQIWIGTWFDGLYRYDGHAYRHYLLGTESPGNAVSSILVDRKGGLWIGTYIGLLYFADGEPQAKRSLFLDTKLITSMLEDQDGSVLVGTSTGLFRVRDGRSTQITNLPNAHVLSITRDSLGYTWIGTKAGGLSLLREDHLQSLGEKSEVPMLPINTAIEDGDGHLWLGTIRGIVRVKVAALHDVADGRESSLAPIFFGREDGMRSSECVGTSLPAAARAPDGTLWFVTSKGFVHTTDVAENLVHTHPIHPTLGWTLTDDMNPAHALEGDHIVMSPSQPDATFLFNVIELSNPSHIEFRYRLKGYDADWITTHSRSVRYRRLPSGSYSFALQARRSGEPWEAVTTTVQVRQRSHFYQTWYFYLAMLLLAGILAIQAFRQRVRFVKGQIGVVLEERNRIARECHDTLMAGFAAISWQLEATSKLFRTSELTDTPAAQSCELARSMVSHCQAEARRIIWDLRDTEEMTNILSHALSRTISAHDPGDGIQITLRVEGEEIPLAPAYVHHLMSIGQEAVLNAMKHASPTHIAVHLRYEASALQLLIRDDGCGFRGDTSKVGHFGIAVMEERARKVGGVLRVQSSLNGGTDVSVNVTFHSLQIMTPQTMKAEGRYVVPWIGI
ncbi:sensor histidine kinase [Acidicapsa ligni]|uniref:sensor histidine kinase n=1 Tax=Acidicapsa ligni TaxID=542300 RepID=UPI0021E08B62|nr:sensor histidine kinase [Acidicapsa ligni]